MQEPYDETLRQFRALLRAEDREAARKLAESAAADCEAKGLTSLAALFRGAAVIRIGCGPVCVRDLPLSEALRHIADAGYTRVEAQATAPTRPEEPSDDAN